MNCHLAFQISPCLTHMPYSQSLGVVVDLGIHVTWHARKLITDHLVSALELTWHLNFDKVMSGKLANWPNQRSVREHVANTLKIL